jgi:hypothetical protein
MAMTDNDLLRFDKKRLAHYDDKEARATLQGEHADAYRAQLVAAHWIDYWRDGLERSPGIPAPSEEWMEGFSYAMREIAAHLRQGGLIPGGTLHDETWRRGQQAA